MGFAHQFEESSTLDVHFHEPQKPIEEKLDSKKRMTSFHDLEQLITIKCPIEMMHILQEEEEVVESSPKIELRPTITRSSMNSLATPWLDVFPMVPSSFPFLCHEEDHTKIEEREVTMSSCSRGVSLNPTFSFFSSLHHTRSSCSHYTFHCEEAFLFKDHVCEFEHMCHLVSSSRTRSSCVHFCSFSQFLKTRKMFVMCLSFVSKCVMCISCSTLKHIFRLKLGKTCAWKFS